MVEALNSGSSVVAEATEIVDEAYYHQSLGEVIGKNPNSLFLSINRTLTSKKNKLIEWTVGPESYKKAPRLTMPEAVAVLVLLRGIEALRVIQNEDKDLSFTSEITDRVSGQFIRALSQAASQREQLLKYPDGAITERNDLQKALEEDRKIYGGKMTIGRNTTEELIRTSIQAESFIVSTAVEQVTGLYLKVLEKALAQPGIVAKIEPKYNRRSALSSLLSRVTLANEIAQRARAEDKSSQTDEVYIDAYVIGKVRPFRNHGNEGKEDGLMIYPQDFPLRKRRRHCVEYLDSEQSKKIEVKENDIVVVRKKGKYGPLLSIEILPDQFDETDGTNIAEAADNFVKRLFGIAPEEAAA